VGKERTIESFQAFFAAMGQEVISKICFVCSDMWEPYLKLIREKCSEALHILDRYISRARESACSQHSDELIIR
jgi:transposase